MGDIIEMAARRPKKPLGAGSFVLSDKPLNVAPGSILNGVIIFSREPAATLAVTGFQSQSGEPITLRFTGAADGDGASYTNLALPAGATLQASAPDIVLVSLRAP